MADYVALPLFTDAWVADTAHLCRLERGLYFDLLVLMWRSPECRVPADRAWISRKLRIASDEVDALENIIAEFCKSDGNFVTQKRLLKEWGYVRKKSRTNTAAAKSRWNKDKDGCERTDDALRPQSERNAPTPTPTPTIVEEDDEERGRADARAAPVDHPTDLSDMLTLAGEACRAGGIRHLEPSHIGRHVDLVREWRDAGADPPLIIATIAGVVANATEPIHSLKFFAPAIRQAVARQEGNQNGHAPAQVQRDRGRQRGDGLTAAVGRALAELGEQRGAAAEPGGAGCDPEGNDGRTGLRLIEARAS